MLRTILIIVAATYIFYIYMIKVAGSQEADAEEMPQPALNYDRVGIQQDTFELVADHYTEGDKEGIQINLFQHDQGYTSKTLLSTVLCEPDHSVRERIYVNGYLVTELVVKATSENSQAI